MALRSTTKMAWQAALAIALSELLRHFFNMDRGYWITLAAMALTTQTWGDSLKRSIERVSMTILGGLFGTLLYWITPPNPHLIVGLLLFFVLIAVYFLQIYHLLAMFALTGFVVFLFAIFGEWNMHLLGDRIIDTGIGAFIAIAVGRLFMAKTTDIEELFAEHIEKMHELLGMVFEEGLSINDVFYNENLYSNFQQIRKNALAISYEIFFRRLNPRDFRLLLTESAFCTQYVMHLTETYSWVKSSLTQTELDKLQVAVTTTQFNLTMLHQRLKKEPYRPLLPVNNVNHLLVKAIEEQPLHFVTLNNEVLGFYNLMFFFTRLNMRIHEINSLLSKSR